MFLLSFKILYKRALSGEEKCARCVLRSVDLGSVHSAMSLLFFCSGTIVTCMAATCFLCLGSLAGSHKRPCYTGPRGDDERRHLSASSGFVFYLQRPGATFCSTLMRVLVRILGEMYMTSACGEFGDGWSKSRYF